MRKTTRKTHERAVRVLARKGFLLSLTQGELKHGAADRGRGRSRGGERLQKQILKKRSPAAEQFDGSNRSDVEQRTAVRTAGRRLGKRGIGAASIAHLLLL